MRNLCGKGKELTAAVNGESVRLTRSLRSLDTRPLRAFIITLVDEGIEAFIVVGHEHSLVGLEVFSF